MWDVRDEYIDGSISRCQNGAPVHHLNNQQLLHRNDVTLLVGRAQGSAWCYGTKGGLYFFLSLPEHGTQPGGLCVKGTGRERIPPPLTDQLDLNQLLLLLKAFFLLLPWGVLPFWLTLFQPFCRYKIVKEQPTKRVFSVVHVLDGKKFDIYIMQRPSFLHPRQNVNWELLKLWKASSLPPLIRLTFKDGRFCYGKKASDIQDRRCCT